MKRTDKVCPECGETFHCPIAGAWVYKRAFFDSHIKYFCCHSCYTKYTAKMEAEKRRRKRERVKRMMERSRANAKAQ